MSSIFSTSPLKAGAFLAGYFFLINLQSQFEVASFIFFVAYSFLFIFFAVLARYICTYFVGLLRGFLRGKKYTFFLVQTLVTGLYTLLKASVFTLVSRSFFDLWCSFWRLPIALVSLLTFYIGVCLTFINFFSRPASLSMWASSDRIYVTEAEFILKKSHTRIEVCFFLWSLANRLAFLFFPIYFIFPSLFFFDEPFDGWDCWDANFRRNTIEWPFFFFVAFLVFDLLCEIYRDWWCVKAVPSFFCWVATLQDTAQAPLLTSLYTFTFFLRLSALLVFFFIWWASAYFIFCYVYLQAKIWVFTFWGFNLPLISLVISMVLYFFMDITPLLFFVF